MSTRTLGPVGIEHDESSAAELAIVGRLTFAGRFNLARKSSPLIADATSPFDHHRDETDTVFRLALDGRSGYAVRANGELVYVFSLEPGRGAAMVTRAVERDDAIRLDCFAGYLPTFYGRHGFIVTRREVNWTPGGPDVVYMSLCTCEAARGRYSSHLPTCPAFA